MTPYNPTSLRFPRLRLTAALALALGGPMIGMKAVTYTWDPDAATAGVQSGSGTWDTTGPVWTTDGGTTHVAWVDGTSNTISSGAVFAGDDTGGIISLGTNRTIAVTGNSLNFLNSGYTLQSANASVRTINFLNSTALLVAAGKSVTIGSKVTLSNAVVGGTSGTANGTINIDSGGKLSSSGTMSILGDGTLINVKAGGAITAGGTIVMGNAANDRVSLVVDGGDVTVTSSSQGNLGLNNGPGATNVSSSATLNSGTITLAGTSSRVLMGAANSATVTTTFNLNGGTLTTSAVTDTTASVSTFNFNGGTLKAGLVVNGLVVATAGNFMDALNNAVVKAGGAKVDSNGSDIKIAAALSHDSGLGSTPDGGFEKLGEGTLTLTGANTYTGATTVTAGGLATAATGTFGEGSISLAAGTSLTLGNASSIADTASLVFSSTSLVNLSFVGQETLFGLQRAAGSSIGAGTYDADELNNFFGGNVFSGDGELTVVGAVPEPATWAMLAGAAALVGATVMRRRVRA